MAKVLCTLPNASSLINGIAFEAVPRGMLSVDDISDDVAEAFGSIAGYEVLTPMEIEAETEADVAEAAEVEPKKRGRPAKVTPTPEPNEEPTA